MIEEIERKILGVCIQNPLDCVIAIETLKCEHFSIRGHEIVFKAILTLFKGNNFIDINSVIKQIRKNGDFAELKDGKMFIAKICNLTGGSIDLATNIKLLIENYLRNKLFIIGNQIVYKSENDVYDPFSIINEFNKEIEGLIGEIPASNVYDLTSIKNKLIAELYKSLDVTQTFGISTGLRKLDAQINGWQKSDLIILAGRPGSGKSTAAMNFAVSAILNKVPVGFFSLEMSKEQLVGRLLSIVSGINSQDIIMKKLNENSIKTLIDRSNILNKMPLYIDESASLSTFEFKNKSRKLVKEKGVKMIIVDYLQLMDSESKRSSREQQISEISRSLKLIAKELNVPVIALSQMSRDIEKRADKRPQLSDLRESGAIEQDADMVIFCYRPDMMGINEIEIKGLTQPSNDLFIIDIKKFRNGQPGEIIAKIIPQLTKIENYEY